MQRGQKIYAIQKDASSEQYAYRILTIDQVSASILCDHRGAKPFTVTLDELAANYTTTPVSQQIADNATKEGQGQTHGQGQGHGQGQDRGAAKKVTLDEPISRPQPKPSGDGKEAKEDKEG